MSNPADKGPTGKSGPDTEPAAEDPPAPPPYEPDPMIVKTEIREGESGPGITFDELHDADE